MHPCPCCGYQTLPDRAAYDLCPVCWWEDEGLEPWEYSGPNGQTLVEAQQEFLAQRRPYRLRPGQVRAPKRREARDPNWRPFELTDELMDRVRREHLRSQRAWAESERRVTHEGDDDPGGQFTEYDEALRELETEAAHLPPPLETTANGHRPLHRLGNSWRPRPDPGSPAGGTEQGPRPPSTEPGRLALIVIGGR